MLMDSSIQFCLVANLRHCNKTEYRIYHRSEFEVDEQILLSILFALIQLLVTPGPQRAYPDFRFQIILLVLPQRYLAPILCQIYLTPNFV